MTTLKIIEGQIQEILLGEDSCNPFEKAIRRMNMNDDERQEVVDWHKESIIKVLQAEIERKRGMKYVIDWQDGRTMYGKDNRHTSNEALAYNQALEEDITHLTDLINNIK